MAAVNMDAAAAAAQSAAGPEFLTTSEFMDGFQLPSYVFDGIVLSGNLYSVCGKTGQGKSAVALYLAFLKATGGYINGSPVEQGKVVYLAAENPEDIRMRVLLMANRMDLDYRRLPISWVAGAFDPSEGLERARDQVGDAELFIVDTGAAFALQGGSVDENDNAGQLAFAKDLRAFTELPSKPTVLALMRPIKRAKCQDELLPRGGGSFLAEVDGNLTIWAEGDRSITELHWTGKIRGPNFEPLPFVLEAGTCPQLVDAKGRELTSVRAYPADRHTMEKTTERNRTDLDDMLNVLDQGGATSLAKLCEILGWTGKNGQLQKSRARRVMDQLTKERIAEKSLGHYRITTRGRRALKKGEPTPIRRRRTTCASATRWLN